MTILRVTARWTGWSGAPGYTNLFFGPTGAGDYAQPEVDKVQSFFTAVRDVLPNVVSIQVDPEVALIDEVTGTLEQYLQADVPPGAVGGTGGEQFASASGACITWNTDTVNRGRRVRGRTFLVPMAAAEYDTDGTLSDIAQSQLNAGVSALLDASVSLPLVAWSRPVNGAGGVAAPVVSGRAPDKVAVLRSRRD